MAQWVVKEMEGYREDDELPAHRIWKLTIVGSLHNPIVPRAESDLNLPAARLGATPTLSRRGNHVAEFELCLP